jgi:hypothetical protein
MEILPSCVDVKGCKWQPCDALQDAIADTGSVSDSAHEQHAAQGSPQPREATSSTQSLSKARPVGTVSSSFVQAAPEASESASEDTPLAFLRPTLTHQPSRVVSQRCSTIPPAATSQQNSRPGTGGQQQSGGSGQGNKSHALAARKAGVSSSHLAMGDSFQRRMKLDATPLDGSSLSHELEFDF